MGGTAGKRLGWRKARAHTGLEATAIEMLTGRCGYVLASSCTRKVGPSTGTSQLLVIK